VLLGHRSPAVIASALELLHGRDLPPDVLSHVVGLLGHEDPAVVWTALAVLDGRTLTEALVTLGVSLLFEAAEVDTKVIGHFLRGRLLPQQSALMLSGWLAEAPAARWPVAVELEWPAALAARMAVHVRAMAAARAVERTAALDGLVAETARRWLIAESQEGWSQAADAARAVLDEQRGEDGRARPA
jgi:hypothetical protein